MIFIDLNLLHLNSSCFNSINTIIFMIPSTTQNNNESSNFQIGSSEMILSDQIDHLVLPNPSISSNPSQDTQINYTNNSRNRNHIHKSNIQTEVVFNASPEMVKHSVRFPGKINPNPDSISKAVNMLGGLNTVNQVFQENSKRLELCFHPESKRISMVSSKPKSVCRILMKVQYVQSSPDQTDNSNNISNTINSTNSSNSSNITNNNNPKDQNQNGIYHVELTPISKHVEFESLCDFQFLKKPRAENLQSEEQFLSLIPGSFLQSKKTFDYKYNSVPIAKRSYVIPIFIVSINDEEKPKYYVGKDCRRIEDPRQDVPISSDPATQLLRDCIKKLFEIRPIWRRRAFAKVLGNHPFLTTFRIKSNLPYFAYTLKDGPWSQLLIRYGVDPKSNPNYGKYQNMYFRIPRTLRVFVDEGFSENRNYLFEGIPEQWNTTYCLCDIRLRRVVEIVQNPQQTYHPVYGFYTSDNYDEIRKVMKQILLKIFEQKERNLPEASDLELVKTDEFHNISPDDFNFEEKLRLIERGIDYDFRSKTTPTTNESEQETNTTLNKDIEMNDESSLSDSSFYSSNEDEMIIDD